MTQLNQGSDPTMAGEASYMRWTPSEWQRVAVATLPHLDKGLEVGAALYRGQRVLPMSRRREEDTFQRLQHQASTKRQLEAARAMTPEQRAEIVPPAPPRKTPAPRKSLDEGRDYNRQDGGVIRWTTLEKARVARQVNQWLAAGDTRALSRLIIEAQELVIDRERRRPITSIQQATSTGRNEEIIAEGTANIWLLQQHEASAAEAEPCTPDPGASQAPIEGPEPAAEAASPTQAPITPTPAPRALSEAARIFGETVMGALDTLLATHTEVLLREVYAKLSATAAATSDEIAKQVAAQIERGMRETVHKIVEAELGGPVSPPPAAEAAAPAAQPAATMPQPKAKPQPIKVDVVGLVNGTMEQQVRQAINGHADLRFFDPDSRNGYAPHRGRHCIMVTQRVPHALKDKIRASGVEPIYVKSTPGHVIHAIEELRRSHG